jgi:hypothetical protein
VWHKKQNSSRRAAKINVGSQHTQHKRVCVYNTDKNLLFLHTRPACTSSKKHRERAEGMPGPVCFARVREFLYVIRRNVNRCPLWWWTLIFSPFFIHYREQNALCLCVSRRSDFVRLGRRALLLLMQSGRCHQWRILNYWAGVSLNNFESPIVACTCLTCARSLAGESGHMALLLCINLSRAHQSCGAHSIENLQRVLHSFNACVLKTA